MQFKVNSVTVVGFFLSDLLVLGQVLQDVLCYHLDLRRVVLQPHSFVPCALALFPLQLEYRVVHNVAERVRVVLTDGKLL